eukprot:m.253665 g.253665  ORF g.253665 m.253665 type:complete len:295 (-) comp127358_c0_seq1:20-904(-)
MINSLFFDSLAPFQKNHQPKKAKEASRRRDVFKVLVIGDAEVGKSMLLATLTGEPFVEEYSPTIGVELKNYTATVDGKPVKMNILDAAGQQRYRSLTTSCYKGTRAVVLVYDVTFQSSFDHVRDWLIEIDRYAGPDVTRMLIGNKIDASAPRLITHAQGQELAASVSIPFHETSAKDGSGVQAAFDLLAATLARQAAAAAKRPVTPDNVDDELAAIPHKVDVGSTTRLANMSVADVCKMLSEIGMAPHAREFEKHKIDGKRLLAGASEQERILTELGVSNAVQRQRLRTHLQTL